MSRALRVPSFVQQSIGFAVLAEKTARAKLTYRMATIISLVASGFAYSVVILVWLQVYRENPRPGPYSLNAMLAYLVTAFLTSELLSLGVELRFLQRVRMGLVAMDVVRPVGFLAFQMAQALGDVLVNLAFAVPIFAVGVWFVGSALVPPSLGAGLLGLVSVGLAFFVTFGLSYLIVQAAFVLQSGYGIFFARIALHQVFSGLAAPLVMFPAPLRRVAEWLPFRHVIETPVSIWLGHAQGSAIPRLLAEQAAWGLGLIAVGNAIFSAVLKRHQMQGG